MREIYDKNVFKNYFESCFFYKEFGGVCLDGGNS